MDSGHGMVITGYRSCGLGCGVLVGRHPGPGGSDSGWGCKEQVLHEVAHLSMMMGSSWDRRMDRIST